MANGTFTAAAQTSSWIDAARGTYSGGAGSELMIIVAGVAGVNSGNFAGSVALDVRSKSLPAVVVPAAVDPAGTPLALTVAAALAVRVPVSGLEYRLRCVTLTAGNISWQLGTSLSP